MLFVNKGVKGYRGRFNQAGFDNSAINKPKAPQRFAETFGVLQFQISYLARLRVTTSKMTARASTAARMIY